MEDVLDVYTRPYDSNYPVVCLDETSKQLVKETRIPLPVNPDILNIMTMNMSGTEFVIYLCCLNP
jgi:hypothetical protein